MRFSLRLSFCLLALVAAPAFGFVHIHHLKPRLPVSPEQPVVNFFWNGAAPSLKNKDEVLDGMFADATDAQLMEALLVEAMRIWTNVETSYIELEVTLDANVEVDDDDETFAIVVEEQASKTIAAAALPSFISQDPDPSPREKDEHIIHDCDIIISSASVSAKSLLRTLVHELGHCLGLGHPHSNYLSIMSYASLNNEAKLGLDDEAGVSFLYPSPGLSQDVNYLTSCGTLGTSSMARGAWILLLPLGFVGWRVLRLVRR